MPKKINSFSVTALPNAPIFIMSGTKKIFDFKPDADATVFLKIEIEQEIKEAD